MERRKEIRTEAATSRSQTIRVGKTLDWNEKFNPTRRCSRERKLDSVFRSVPSVSSGLIQTHQRDPPRAGAHFLFFCVGSWGQDLIGFRSQSQLGRWWLCLAENEQITPETNSSTVVSRFSVALEMPSLNMHSFPD